MTKNLSNSKKSADTRYRNFEYVVYDGDSNVNFATIEVIEQIADGDFYATIKHPSETGKDHWHCFFSFENNKTLSAFCKTLQKLGFGDEHLPHDDFPGNVRVKDDFVSAVQYLAHLSPKAIQDHKKSYSIDEIQTNDIERMRKCFLNSYTRATINSSKNKMCSMTYAIIDNTESMISRSDWFDLCDDNDIDSNIARSNDVLRYLDEHNRNFARDFLYEYKVKANAYKEIQKRLESVFKITQSIILEKQDANGNLVLDICNQAKTLLNDHLTGMIEDIELEEVRGAK